MIRTFILKSINLIIIILALALYGVISSARLSSDEEAKAAYAAAKEEVEAKNLESANMYEDGTFTGTAFGYGGDIEVEVTVSGGKIAEINVLSHEDEDAAYFEMAISVIDDIIAANSTEVDAVSGATFSSTGIIEAVEDAIKSTEGKE